MDDSFRYALDAAAAHFIPETEFARKKPSPGQIALNHRNDIRQRESAQYDRNRTGEFSRVGPNGAEMWSGPSMIAADATNAAHISSKAAGGEGHRLSSIVHKQVGSRMLSGPPSVKSHRSAANNHELVASEHEKASSSSNGDEQKLHVASAYLHRKAAQLHRSAESSLTTSEFARKPAPGQTAFNWDEDSHPRESAEHDGKRPGEFAPKEHEAEQAESPARKWYGMSLRPPAPGAIPKGSFEHKPHPDFRHGQISYDTPLTADQMRDYELTPIHEDSDIPGIAKAVGDELGEHASQYADPGNDELLDDVLKQGRIRPLLGHVDKDKLKAEIRKQFGGSAADEKSHSEQDRQSLDSQKEQKSEKFTNDTAVSNVKGGKGRFAGCATVGEMRDKLRGGERILFKKYRSGWQAEVHGTRAGKDTFVASADPDESAKDSLHPDKTHAEGPQFNDMVRAAAGYQFHGMRNEPQDRDAWREHSKHMTKSAVDKWLMGKFGIDSATARSVSNAAGEMNPFTTEGAGTVGGEDVKWNHNSPEPTMGEIGDVPWKPAGGKDTAPPISKELAEKYPSLVDSGFQTASPHAQPSAEETPRQRANRRMFEDDIKAIYRNAGDAATVHGNTETASQIAKLTGAKSIDAGEEFNNALKSEVEGVGETMDSFHEAMKDGRRGSASRLAEKAWKSVADKINSDPEKLVVHGIDNLPEMGVENTLQHLKGAGFRDSGRDGESATIVVGKDSGIKPPSGRHPITQEANPEVEANAAQRDAQIAKERKEREEAEAPAKAREAVKKKADDEAESQARKAESDRSNEIAQEVRSKMMATVDKMKPKEGFTVPKKITKKFRSELENHIAIATDVRNPALLSEAADRWLSVHAHAAEGKSAGGAPSPQKSAGSKHSDNEWSPENHLKIAADSIDKLRGQDIHRLLDSAPPARMQQMATYIRKHRPEFSSDIHDAQLEIENERPGTANSGQSPVVPLSELRSSLKSQLAESEANEAAETKRLTSEKSRASGSAKKAAIDDQWRAMKDEMSKKRIGIIQSFTKQIESHPEYQQEKAETSRKAKEMQAKFNSDDSIRAESRDSEDWNRLASSGGYDAAKKAITAEIASINSRLSKTKEPNKWKLESNLARKKRELARIDELKSRFGDSPKQFSRAACDCRAHLVTAIHTALNFDGKHKTDDSIARSIPEDPAQIDQHVAEVLRELANTSPDVQKALGEYLAS